MVEIYCNCSINEASQHFSFEVSYGFQPTTHGDRLFPLTGAPAFVVDHLAELASVIDVDQELLTLSKQRMVARSFLPALIFVIGDIVFLHSKGSRIHSQKCKHLRDQRLFQVIEKVGVNSYKR
jgi:hypothetical protein